MTSRFVLSSLFRAHWKGLTLNEPESTSPPADKVARWILVGGSSVAALLAGVCRADLGEPSLRLAALALLTGSLLTVFAQLSSLRLKFTEWFPAGEQGHRVEKDMIDESVSHVLFAAVLSLFAAGVTVASAIVTAPSGWAGEVLRGISAGLTVGLLYYIVALVVMTLPRLYAAYVAVNDVSSSLDGSVTDSRTRPMKFT